MDLRRALFSYDKGLYIDSYDAPSPKDDEVLIKLKYAGLCASDLHYIRGRFKYSKLPIVPGHEGSGVVWETGNQVEHISKGDRVIIDYVKGCGACKYCIDGKENRCIDAKFYGFDLDGTFQEYIVLPWRNMAPVPSDITLDKAAIIGCAVVTPYHAIKEVGGVEGKDIAVIGLGGVGIHCILLSRLLDADTIIGIDIEDSKESIAYEYGADHFINPEKEDPVKSIHRILGEGVDIAFEFVGKPETIKYALDMTKRGGTSLLAGLVEKETPVNFIDIIAGEKRIFGVEDHTHSDLRETIELIANRGINLSPSITHKFSLEEIWDAVKLLEYKYEPVNRILIEI